MGRNDQHSSLRATVTDLIQLMTWKSPQNPALGCSHVGSCLSGSGQTYRRPVEVYRASANASFSRPLPSLTPISTHHTTTNLQHTVKMAPHNDVQEVSPPANGKTNGQTYTIPTEMKAIRYNKVKDWSLVTMPVPKPRAHEILVKGMKRPR